MSIDQNSASRYFDNEYLDISFFLQNEEKALDREISSSSEIDQERRSLLTEKIQELEEISNSLIRVRTVARIAFFNIEILDGDEGSFLEIAEKDLEIFQKESARDRKILNKISNIVNRYREIFIN